MVDVFREVKRVLRKDGVCWVNYGDSYAGSINGRSAEGGAAVTLERVWLWALTLTLPAFVVSQEVTFSGVVAFFAYFVAVGCCIAATWKR